MNTNNKALDQSPKPDKIILIFIVAILAMLISVVAGSIYYSASNTHTEEVSTGRGMDIILGYLVDIPGYRGSNLQFAVMSDEGVQLETLSKSRQETDVTGYLNEDRRCIYLQQHLIRTVTLYDKAEYRQYASLEGIRDPNDDGTCADFPVD